MSASFFPRSTQEALAWTLCSIATATCVVSVHLMMLGMQSNLYASRVIASRPLSVVAQPIGQRLPVPRKDQHPNPAVMAAPQAIVYKGAAAQAPALTMYLKPLLILGSRALLVLLAVGACAGIFMLLNLVAQKAGGLATWAKIQRKKSEWKGISGGAAPAAPVPSTTSGTQWRGVASTPLPTAPVAAIAPAAPAQPAPSGIPLKGIAESLKGAVSSVLPKPAPATQWKGIAAATAGAAATTTAPTTTGSPVWRGVASTPPPAAAAAAIAPGSAAPTAPAPPAAPAPFAASGPQWRGIASTPAPAPAAIVPDAPAPPATSGTPLKGLAESLKGAVSSVSAVLPKPPAKPAAPEWRGIAAATGAASQPAAAPETEWRGIAAAMKETQWRGVATAATIARPPAAVAPVQPAVPKPAVIAAVTIAPPKEDKVDSVQAQIEVDAMMKESTEEIKERVDTWYKQWSVLEESKKPSKEKELEALIQTLAASASPTEDSTNFIDRWLSKPSFSEAALKEAEVLRILKDAQAQVAAAKANKGSQ